MTFLVVLFDVVVVVAVVVQPGITRLHVLIFNQVSSYRLTTRRGLGEELNLITR